MHFGFASVQGVLTSTFFGYMHVCINEKTQGKAHPEARKPRNQETSSRNQEEAVPDLDTRCYSQVQKSHFVPEIPRERHDTTGRKRKSDGAVRFGGCCSLSLLLGCNRCAGCPANQLQRLSSQGGAGSSWRKVFSPISLQTGIPFQRYFKLIKRIACLLTGHIR